MNTIGIDDNLDWERIRHLLKLGLFAGALALVGDILLGWGVADESVTGMEGYFSRYLAVSDIRIFWSAFLGLIGIPVGCMSYFAIYRLMADKSLKHAHACRAGLFGMMIFGAGVHALCCAAIYFYKKIYGFSQTMAAEEALQFMMYFLLPATVLFLVFYGVFIGVHISAFVKEKTPYPKWAWIFNPLFGMVCAAVMKLVGNYPLTNALSTGWINLGGMWMCGGLLALSGKAEETSGSRKKGGL